jgi:hypothetical protein
MFGLHRALERYIGSVKSAAIELSMCAHAATRPPRSPWKGGHYFAKFSTFNYKKNGWSSPVDRTIARLNIEHFTRLLERETDEGRRQMLLRLLAEEKEKFNRAESDPPERKAHI